ncbi:hypothetical protein RCL1_004388 [Eukaryota sp. TZLM3-RCL]
MSSHHSTAVSGASTVDGGDRSLLNIFNTIRKLSRCFGRHRLLAQVFFYIEILRMFCLLQEIIPELIALVVNPYLDWAYYFDPRELLHRLLLPAFYVDTSYWFIPFNTTMFIFIGAISLLILFFIWSYVGIARDSPKSYILKITRVFLEIIAGPLFLPILLHSLTHITCSDEGIWVTRPSSQCLELPIIGIRIGAFILSLLTIFIKLVHTNLIYDSFVQSRKFFSRSHSLWLNHFIFMRVAIAFTLINVDHIPWVFVVVYPLVALFALISFILLHPFYSKEANKRTAALLGSWVGISLLWTSLKFLNYFINFKLTGVLNLISYSSIFVVFGVLFYFVESFLYSRKCSRIPKLNPSLVALNGEDLPSTPVIPNAKSLYSFELFSRFLVLSRRPTKGSLSVATNLWEIAASSLPESAPVLILKAHYEVCYLQNTLSAAVTLNSIKTLDVDISFFWKYRIHDLSLELDTLRRLMNTGTQMDSGSFIQIQKQLRDTKELVQECLDHLKAFWSHLLSPNPELQQLPVLTQRIHSTRTECDASFKKLLFSGKGNKEILFEYMVFIRDVVQDEDLLATVQTQYELMETDSQNSSSHDNSSRAPSEQSSFARKSNKKNKRRKRNAAALLQLNALSDHNTAKDSAISVLWKSIIFATFVVFGLSLTGFVASNTALSSIRDVINQYYEADHLGFLSNDLGFSVRLATLLADPTLNIPTDFSLDLLYPHIAASSEHLALHTRRLYLGSEYSKFVGNDTLVCPGINQNSEIIPLYNSEYRHLFIESNLASTLQSSSIPSLRFTEATSFWQLVLLYSRSALDIIGHELLEENSDELISRISSFNFVLSNQIGLSNSIDRLWDALETSSLNTLDLQVFTGVIILSISIILLVCIGYFAFRRAFVFITDERNYILNLFLLIPREAIQAVLQDPKFDSKSLRRKKISQQNHQDSEFSSSEDEAIQFTKPVVEATKEEESGEVNNPLTVYPNDHVVQLNGEENQSEMIEEEVKSNGIFPIYIAFVFSILVIFVITAGLLYFSLETSFYDLESSLLLSVDSLILTEELIEFQSDTSLAALGFSQFSEFSFFDNYWDLLGSGEQEIIMEELIQVVDSSDLLELLGQNLFYDDLLQHYSRVAFVLSFLSSDMDLSRFARLANFNYDLEAETLAHFNRVRFPNAKFSYQNLINDSMLTADEQRTIARYTLANDQYQYYFSKRYDSLVSLQESVVDSAWQSINDVQLGTERGVVIALGVSITVLLLFFFTCMFSIFKLHFFRLKIGSFICIGISTVISLAIIILSIGVLTLASQIVSDFAIQDEVSNALYAATRAEAVYERSSSYFSQFGSTSVFTAYFNQENYWNDLYKVINRYSELHQGTKVADVLEQLTRTIDSVASTTDELRDLQQTSLALGASGYDLPIALQKLISNHTWDIEDHPDYYIQQELYSHIPVERRWSNKEDDLTKTSDEQQLLSRAVLFSPRYHYLRAAYKRRLSRADDELFDGFEDVFNHLFDETYFDLKTLEALSIALALSMTISAVILYLALTPSKKESDHVKQRITVHLVKLLTKHYIVSLSIIGIVLSVFLLFLIYSLLSSRHVAPELNLAGQRLSLVMEALSLVTEAIARPVDRALLRTQLTAILEKLQTVHYKLLFGTAAETGSAGRYVEQDEIIFITNYLNHTDSTPGVSVLVEAFVALGRQFATATTGVSFSLDGYHFLHLYEIANDLSSLLMRSLDVFRSEGLDSVAVFITISRVLFAIFVVTLLVIFFFVFKKMIQRLKDEEEVTLVLLNTIPESVVNEVPLISEFLASKEGK